MDRKEFVEKYARDAVRVTQGTGIFPQTLLTMAIVESANSKGEVLKGRTVKYNNLFGIKASPTWKGKTVELPTSKDSTKTSVFRVYNSYQDSFKDYVKFLQINPTYREHGVFDSSDYIEQLANIARSGYAENKNYNSILSSVAATVRRYFPEVTNTQVKGGLILAGLALLLIAISDE
jgi:flagellum-specific peptidoglycan hydrolase FlgJ